MAKIKVQISLEEELLKEIDLYCEKNYMNRSWMISQATVQALNQQKMIDSMANLAIALKNVTENGEIDDETRREMERFETLCKLFVTK